MTADARLAEEFEEHRPRLVAIATRVLGDRAGAEDVVQEAWLRLARQEPGSVENLGGWLTTVVGRLCLDVLRSRTAKGEVALDEERDPVVTPDAASDETAGAAAAGRPEVDPEEQALHAEAVGLALLVVLGSLRPDERLAFVLHDLFAVPFAEIGPIIGKSPDAAKMTASRARRKVHGAAPPTATRTEQRRVVDAFLAAARDGDFDALLEILDPDLTWELRGGRGRRVHFGRDDLVAAVVRGHRADVVAARVLVDGQPGVLAWGPTGRPGGLMACTVEGGRITRVVSWTERRVLDRIDLPRPSR